MSADTQEATETRIVSRDGTEIAYFTTGDGPPLLLVHGTTADHTRFIPLLPYLEPHATVHAMDRRGRGASGDAPDYDVAREHEDVAAVIDDIADSTGSPVDVYGHSQGSLNAWGAALLTSNIRTLMLYEGWPTPNPEVSGYPPGLEERMEELLARGERDAMIEIYFRELIGFSQEQIDMFRAQPVWQVRVASAHTIAREDHAFFGTRFDPDEAARIAVPTLLLTGDETPLALRADMDVVAAALPDARISVIEGQGHGGDVLAPEDVAGRMLAFLREHR